MDHQFVNFQHRPNQNIRIATVLSANLLFTAVSQVTPTSKNPGLNDRGFSVKVNYHLETIDSRENDIICGICK